MACAAPLALPNQHAASEVWPRHTGCITCLQPRSTTLNPTQSIPDNTGHAGILASKHNTKNNIRGMSSLQLSHYSPHNHLFAYPTIPLVMFRTPLPAHRLIVWGCVGGAANTGRCSSPSTDWTSPTWSSSAPLVTLVAMSAYTRGCYMIATAPR